MGLKCRDETELKKWKKSLESQIVNDIETNWVKPVESQSDRSLVSFKLRKINKYLYITNTMHPVTNANTYQPVFFNHYPQTHTHFSICHPFFYKN